MSTGHHHLQPPTGAGGGGVLPARPFVLLPLYIYPAPGAWRPLWEAADAHPELDFWVVVNPANGPGEGPLPDANYVEALARMTARANVRVIGYVHCSYGARVTEDIVADIEAYGRWEGEMDKRGVEGEVSFFFLSCFLFELCCSFPPFFLPAFLPFLLFPFPPFPRLPFCSPADGLCLVSSLVL